jgi:DNA-binding NtrC family response regulator
MTESNKSKAARILGISRQTLREKLRIYEQSDSDDADMKSDHAEA